MIVASNTVQCDDCGVQANHAIMWWPDNWTIRQYCIDMPQGIDHLCPTCGAKYNVDNRLPYQRNVVLSNDFWSDGSKDITYYSVVETN